MVTPALFCGTAVFVQFNCLLSQTAACINLNPCQGMLMAEYEGHSLTMNIHGMLDAFEDCEECVDVVVGLES